MSLIALATTDKFDLEPCLKYHTCSDLSYFISNILFVFFMVGYAMNYLSTKALDIFMEAFYRLRLCLFEVGTSC